jgi:hypothetical protein
MWQLLTRPDILIFLDASHAVCSQRKRLDWTPAEHAEQLRRLSHARDHSDLYILTDHLTPEEVFGQVWSHLVARA